MGILDSCNIPSKCGLKIDLVVTSLVAVVSSDVELIMKEQ